jgi:hypothetical protein
LRVGVILALFQFVQFPRYIWQTEAAIAKGVYWACRFFNFTPYRVENKKSPKSSDGGYK